MLDILLFSISPGYIFEIGVLLFPLLSVIFFHTPTYRFFISVLDNLGDIVHNFSSLISDLSVEWEKKRTETDLVNFSKSKKPKHSRHRKKTDRILKLNFGVEQETQVTPRDLESIGFRDKFPKLPFYFRSIDTSAPHVWASHLDINEKLKTKKGVSVDIQVNIENEKEQGISESNHNNYSISNFSKISCGIQTDLGETHQHFEHKRVPSFEFSTLSNKFESISLSFNITQTARRYLDKLIPVPEFQYSNLLGIKDTKLQLDRLSLRYIPFEVLDLQGKITHLDLSHNMLTELPEWFIDSCRFIQHLDLSNNYLFELPSSFKHLAKLRELNLSHNRFQQFPNSITNLSGLTYLDISNNSITWVTDNIRLLKGTLNYLDISNNLLMGLPEAFSQLKKLKFLNYEGNYFLYTTRSEILKELEFAVQKKINTPSKEESESSSYKGPYSNLFDKEENSSEVLKEDMSGQSSKGLTMLELLENEKSYVKLLNLMFELYILPLTRNFTDTSKFYDFQNITQKDMHRLFPPEFNEIVIFSRTFFIELKQLAGSYETDPFQLKKIPIGEFFLENKQFFIEKFVPYIRLYESTCKVLNELCKQSPSFAKFIQSRENLPVFEGMQLKSLLILPLYRLHFYSTIIRTLFTLTSQESDDLESVTESYKILSDSFLKQKNEISSFNNRYRIHSIQKRIGVELLKPGRVLVREGRVILEPNQELGKLKNEIQQHMKEKKMSLNPYLDIFLNKMKDKTAGDVVNDIRNIRLTDISVYIYLFNDVIVVREMNILNKIMNGSHIYDLSEASSVKQVPQSSEFMLDFRNGISMTFRCESQEESIGWVGNIKAVISQLRPRRRAEERITEMDLEFSDDDVSTEDSGFGISDNDSILESEDSV